MTEQAKPGTRSFSDFRKDFGAKSQKMAESGRRGGATQPWQYRMQQLFPSDENFPAKMRIIRQPNGKRWYPYYSKWVQVHKNDGSGDVWKRMIISNAHNGLREIPCVLQYYCVTESNQNLLANEMFATTIVVLERFWKVQKESKNKKTFTVYVRVLGNDAKGRPLDPPAYRDSCEQVFGQRYYISMYPTQAERFQQELDDLQDMCGNPGCPGEISVFKYTCPECQHVFADFSDETLEAVTDERLIELQEGDVTCPSCNKDVVAEQGFQCVKKNEFTSDYEAGCDNPIRIGPDDDLDLIVGVKAAGNGKVLFIKQFALAKDYGDELDASLLLPLPFDKFLGQMSLEDQARQMGRDNPYAPSEEALVQQFFETPPDQEDDDSEPFGD